MTNELRDFLKRTEAMKEIIKINDPIIYEKLIKEEFYCAPEARPLKYPRFIQENFKFDINNPISLTIYSLLLNTPIENLKELLVDDSKTK